MFRIAVAAAIAATSANAAWAHHGFGLFQMDTDVEISGTLTSIDLVNPHSYMNLDVERPDGTTLEMRCEMRAAMLIKRMGWSEDMFVPGLPVVVQGHPHRDDPGSCYIETFTLGDGPTIDRNQQFSSDTPLNTENRPLRLASGEINLSGDWAVEQAVLTVPPGGGNGALVPKRFIAAYAAGEITLEEIRAQNFPPARAVYTETGRASADAFRMWSPEDNPRLSCQPTSIIFDWTFDWPINRIVQTVGSDGNQIIEIEYGLYSFSRRIHVGMDSHPSDLEPSNTGHSIGRWEGDTLVVDTAGFAAGVLVPPTRNSEQLHIVERFTIEPETMSLRRDYSVEDPVYLAEPYVGADRVLISDTPFERHPCEELTYEFNTEAETDAP